MADNPFTKPSITGYNANPPSDDGSQTSDNEITWAKHKTKLGDPLNTFATAIADNTETAFNSTINTDDDQNNVMSGSLAFTESELTIASGAITPTRTNHSVDTESDAATDDLVTINTTSVSDGAVLYLHANNTGRVVTLKHGSGNIQLVGGRDMELREDRRIMLLRDSTNWREVTAGPFRDSFTSSEQTITSAGSLTLAHGLGVIPQLVQLYLVCKTTEANYSVDDIVYIHPTAHDDSTSRGISVVPDATNLNVRYGSQSGAFAVLDKTTGTVTALTNANWRLVAKAWA